MQQNSPNDAGMRVSGVRKVLVDSDRAGQRIDNFLRSELPGVPKGRVYRLLRRGEVRVNGGRIRAEYKLKEGDEVRIPPARISTGAPPPPAKLAAEMLDRVIYEDKLGRSRALRYQQTDNYLFPITMISRRREVDNTETVADIYQRARDSMAAVIEPLPFQ